MPGWRPLAITTFSPEIVAMRAAASLLAIPPLLSPVLMSRAKVITDSSRRVTVGISLAPGAGIAVVQAFDIREEDQQRRGSSW